MADLIAWPIVLVAALVGSLLTSEPEECPTDEEKALQAEQCAKQ